MLLLLALIAATSHAMDISALDLTSHASRIEVLQSLLEHHMDSAKIKNTHPQVLTTARRLTAIAEGDAKLDGGNITLLVMQNDEPFSIKAEGETSPQTGICFDLMDNLKSRTGHTFVYAPQEVAVQDVFDAMGSAAEGTVFCGSQPVTDDALLKVSRLTFVI
jgi:hypothetical protein